MRNNQISEKWHRLKIFVQISRTGSIEIPIVTFLHRSWGWLAWII